VRLQEEDRSKLLDDKEVLKLGKKTFVQITQKD
jgi:hypothetical protein